MPRQLRRGIFRGGVAGLLLLGGMGGRAQGPAPDPVPVLAQDPPSFSLAAALPFDTGEALFYAVPGSSSWASFRDHADRIAVIAPQSYSLDHAGKLRGSLPADIAQVARVHAVPIMPLVINADFSRSGAMRLLKSPSARDHAIGALVAEARDQSLSGWQIDFEGLPASQRAAFSRFVDEAATALHRHGKLLSVAVAARTSDDPTSDTYRNFSGVYDYRALGASADFLSIMAYPEGDSTHPGPLASYPWVERVVQHVLLELPADKLSLGLPTYQTDWSERRVQVRVTQKIAGKIRHVFHYVYKLVGHNGAAQHPDDAELHWDPVLQSSYRVVGEGHGRHVIWIEDDRSFAAKLQLIGAYHLRGFSVWRIGLEDPHIWSVLPAAAATGTAAAAAVDSAAVGH